MALGGEKIATVVGFRTDDDHGKITKVALLDNGDEGIVDVYYSDERRSHITAENRFLGKTLSEVQDYVHDKDVADIRSWVA